MFLAAATGAGSSSSMIIILLLFFVLMWFFMIRPEKKKQKKIEAMRSALSVGDEIVKTRFAFSLRSGLSAVMSEPTRLKQKRKRKSKQAALRHKNTFGQI